MRRSFVLVLLILVILPQSSAETYSLDDSFSIKFETRLDGQSSQYEGYTESETETRDYRVTGISGDIVTWEYSYDLNLDSNEDQYDFQDSGKRTFQTNAVTREYIGDGDGDSDYVTFDKIWFRVHPSEVDKGDVVRILGFDYEYKGVVTVKVGFLNAKKVMMFSLVGNNTFYVQNNDYDPDGELKVVINSDSIYFDPETGYFVKEVKRSTGLTSVGTFTWEETSVVTKSSYQLQPDYLGTYIVDPFWAVVFTVAPIWLAYFILMRTWRMKKEVEDAILMISEERFREMEMQAPTIFDPSVVDYKSLRPTSSTGLRLMDGIYLIFDTNNRIAFVDTVTDRKNYLRNYLVTDEKLAIFYKLALGTLDPRSPEIQYMERNAPEVIPFIEEAPISDIIVDSETLRVFTTLDYSEILPDTPEGRQINNLMAMRKLYDYTFGQAPLSPKSHLKKVNEVMAYNPSKVLLIGDDDLISITIARRGIEVYLTEVDPYTCGVVDYFISRENLPIHIFQIDLRNPLPDDIPDDFDIFVADPDFTVAAFALFLKRGMSKLRDGGIGLINFERKGYKGRQIEMLLEKLEVELVMKVEEPWGYVIPMNRTVRVGGGYSYSGKYYHNDYAEDLVLGVAAYRSVMYKVRRTPGMNSALRENTPFWGDSDAIYDFEE